MGRFLVAAAFLLVVSAHADDSQDPLTAVLTKIDPGYQTRSSWDQIALQNIVLQRLAGGGTGQAEKIPAWVDPSRLPPVSANPDAALLSDLQCRAGQNGCQPMAWGHDGQNILDDNVQRLNAHLSQLQQAVASLTSAPASSADSNGQSGDPARGSGQESPSGPPVASGGGAGATGSGRNAPSSDDNPSTDGSAPSGGSLSGDSGGGNPLVGGGTGGRTNPSMIQNHNIGAGALSGDAADQARSGFSTKTDDLNVGNRAAGSGPPTGQAPPGGGRGAPARGAASGGLGGVTGGPSGASGPAGTRPNGESGPISGEPPSGRGAGGGGPLVASTLPPSVGGGGLSGYDGSRADAPRNAGGAMLPSGSASEGGTYEGISGQGSLKAPNAGTEPGKASPSKDNKEAGGEDQLSDEEKKELSDIQQMLKDAADSGALDGPKLADALNELPQGGSVAMNEIEQRVEDMLGMTGRPLTMAERQQVLALASDMALSEAQSDRLPPAVEHGTPPAPGAFGAERPRWQILLYHLSRAVKRRPGACAAGALVALAGAAALGAAALRRSA